MICVFNLTRLCYDRKLRKKSYSVMKFTVLTFYTEGFPYDNGSNQVLIEREFQDHVSKFTDQYIAFNPRKLIGIDETFDKYCMDYTGWLEQHPSRDQLGNYNKCWAKIGFMMWKPIFIQHILNSEKIQPDDIVLYHDVNYHKYPGYILNCESWRDLCVHILDDLKCDIFIPASGYLLKQDVKACLIRKFLGEQYMNKMNVGTCIVVIRKSKISLEFINEWAYMSTRLDNISPLPNFNPHTDFIWHSPEQATAGVLGHAWRSSGRLPLNWPRYMLRNHILSQGSLRKVINSDGEFHADRSARAVLLDIMDYVASYARRVLCGISR